MQKLSVQPNIIKKMQKALLDASKEIGLEVNSEKTKYWVGFLRFSNEKLIIF
jgi:hypothetical protein